ncbi:filamentous haemagglutinin family protein [Caulobacter soli]|uniref:filamentous haemagglutinin family protein n=1 Tax=Caulobacter soli TaxID=2708539 RepID=UPI0013EE3D9B|nr:filamentous haemagglutinin family protein [Caulobacter soli]
MFKSAYSRRLLLASASLVTLLAAHPAVAQTLAGMRGTTGSVSAGAPATGAPVTTIPPMAQQALARQTALKARVANALDLSNQAQSAARAAALAKPSTIPNGLGAGGLVPAGAIRIDPTLWQNANQPTQTVGADGRTTVEIDQTAAKAILTWDSFNVGKDTTVHFDQTAGAQKDGSNEWVVLNRINDPNAKPSTIAGKITAEGSVYLINRNGVIFSGTAQVNTHSLLVSSLAFFGEDSNDRASIAASDKLFLEKGLAGPALSPLDNYKFGLMLGSPDTGPDGVAPPSKPITIEAGAQIETGEAGFSLFAAREINNAGSIVANGGQAILAAAGGLRTDGRNVDKLTVTGVLDSKPKLTNTGVVAALRGSVTLLGSDIVQGGVVLATTSIQQPGAITMTAQKAAGTSNPGLSDSTITFAPGSLTAILPDAKGGTTTSSAAADAAFKPGAATINASRGTVWFQQDSTLYMPGATLNVTAPNIDNLTDAHGDGVHGRVMIDHGVVLDVSGLADVQHAMSDNLVTIPRVGQNELADSPLQRDGILYRSPFTVDGRDSGTRDDGLSWVGSPVVGAGGYAQNQPRTVNDMLVNGGTINLAASGDLIIASGASLNVDGGFLHYLGGRVQTSRLIGTDGRVYSASTADPMMTYVGFAGATEVEHSRWGVTDRFANSLMNGGYESDYVEGGNGGTLAMFSGGTTILNGAISGRTIIGRHQIADGDLPKGATLDLGNLKLAQIAFSDQLSSSAISSYGQGYLLTKDGFSLEALGPDFTIDTSIRTPEMLAKAIDDPTNILHISGISTDIINAGAFTNVLVSGINNPITLARDAAITVQPGGTISLSGAGLTVLGDLTAPGGHINLTSTGQINRFLLAIPANAVTGDRLKRKPGDIVIGADAKLSAAGQWVNDTGVFDGLGHNFIDGGDISIQATAVTGNDVFLSPAFGVMIQYELSGGATYDLTGAVTLEKGSVIDVSSGGYVGTTGKLLMKGGAPAGQGGDITIATYARLPASAASSPPSFVVYGFGGVQPTHGKVELGATLLGYGFSGGGTLSIQAPAIQIGGDAANVPDYGLYLPADYFEGQGFGAYKISASYDATIAAGTTVRVSQRNFLPDYAALLHAPTGANLYATDAAHPQGLYASLGVTDAYDRQPTDFSLRAGDYLQWQGSLTSNLPFAPSYSGVTGTALVEAGASIVADAGADIRIASPGHVTVLGDITAHGGSITLDKEQSAFSFSDPYYHDHGVWLGADATLDVSGVALTDPLVKPARGPDGLFMPRNGRVLDGGSVSLTAINGYVVAETGAVIDVSGASATFDLRRDGVRYLPTSVWSDAGAITLGATNGLLFDGALVAHGGADRGRGGMLTLAQLTGFVGGGGENYLSADAILLQAHGDMVPVGAVAGGVLNAGHTMRFAVDRLDGSGIDTLVLGSDPTSDGGPGFTAPPLTLAFAGDVNLTLDRAILANARDYVLLPDGATTVPASSATPAATDTHVSITAPYVALGGEFSSRGGAYAPRATPGGGVLDVRAGMIDLTGRFNIRNVQTTRFVADGDIRLYTPAGYALLNSQFLPGTLVTGGDLIFQAAQIYPATGNAFVLSAPNAGASITFLGNGKAAAPPLSVGGALLVDAETIVQDGVIRAPSGTIQLGVGDPTDADTIKAFGGLPLVRTRSATLGDGSLTSVSLDGRALPYGTTTDGTDWRIAIGDLLYASPNLAGAPSKFIGIAGDDVNLAKGATVDLSGGGDLYAQEFVPGTGGSRDLLNAVNTVYSTGATPQQVPLYADGRPVYAVIPGYAPPIAAYDPSFGSTGSEVGKSVYLSGVKGLPDGVYTLLPGQYATVPGAFRVVQQTQTSDSVSGDNVTQRDGGQIVSGRFVDGISGKSDARTTSFLVQSAEVWKQYSEYTVTHADDYFPAMAAHDGGVAGRTPADAGRLALAAVSSLILDGQLKASAAAKGRGAAVDISAQDIQILGGSGQARDGYLQVDATALSRLGAESLLIGGTRTDSRDGTVIKATAGSVVLSNDAGSALTGPEIILVTRADATNPNAATGLLIEDGSVLSAKGAIAVADTTPLLIGAKGGATGDGALVRVSNGGAVPVIRANVPGLDGVAGTSAGLLDIRGGARIDGGASTILDSTGDLLVAPGAVFTGKAVDINANTVAFVGAGSSATPGGLVVDAALLGRFANIAALGLHSRSTMGFYGDVTLATGQDLTLGAGAFASDGGSVTITAPKLTLVNDIAGDLTFASGSGALTLEAGELDLGVGAKTLQGFGAVTATASQGVVGQGKGSFDFGSLDVTITAPVFTADSGADSAVVTTGLLTLAAGAGQAIDRTSFGGALSFTGGELVDTALIIAPAGKVTLRATSGDLILGDGAVVRAAGVAKPFRDVTAYAAGGDIALSADQGGVVLAQGALLDVSGAAGGGDAGGLTISAPTKSADLSGVIKGGAAKGYRGGSFGLDVGGAVDLDTLAVTLASSGVNQQIAVHSRAGDLTLSAGATLVARSVALTADADGGVVRVAGTIDASGPAGGAIALSGKGGVALSGSLIATGSDPAQRGGTVRLATSGIASGALDPTYGYELVDAAGSGVITIANGALIDVSGGLAGGLSGGTVAIRAPLLVGGDVNVVIDGGATIRGARDVGLEAYAVWSTADAQPDKTKYFDGIIDPAGWYESAGQMVAGSWTDLDGVALPPPTDAAQLKDYLAKYVFTPTTANTDHQTFYGYVDGDEDAAVPGTLMGFIRNPGFSFEGRFASIANFHARPGVELRNPDPTINGGDVRVLTPWNLGAGTDPTTLAYRYGTEAALLTIRASGDVDVRASLSDGFWQYAVATGAGGEVPTSDLATVDPVWTTLQNDVINNVGDTSYLFGPATGLVGDPVAIAQYYGLYQQYLDFQNSPNDFTGTAATGMGYAALFLFGIGPPDPSNPPPPPPVTANDYPAYVRAYGPYLAKIISDIFTAGTAIPSDFLPLQAPPTTLDIISAAAPVANGPSPQRTKANPLPLASATLAGGASTSYRLVAGADMDGVDPLAVEAAGLRGDVAVDGHLSWVNGGGTVTSGTMIRTGTGAIDIAAAGDVALRDTIAPGTIYTAGRPVAGMDPDQALSVLNTSLIGVPTLVTGEVHPEAGGDVTIRAGGDIAGAQQVYDSNGRYAAQFWWPWLETGNPLDDLFFAKASSINFGAFGQGVMSVGGNVAVTAGGDIRELSVSLPTTWYKTTDGAGVQTVTYVGGGNLSVEAAGDILGGAYFVSKGEGRITAGGAIGSAFTLTNLGASSPVSTLLALQDAVLTVSARGAADIGGIYNPSWLDLPESADGSRMFSDGQSYSARSSLNLSSTSGDARIDTLRMPHTLFGYGSPVISESIDSVDNAKNGRLLPASLAVTAFNGDLYVGGPGELYPSATGDLRLLANGGIRFVNDISGQLSLAAQFGMSDAPSSYLPSPLNPPGYESIWNSIDGSGSRFDVHEAGLHSRDYQPIRIYALTGDIVDGAIAASGPFVGFSTNGMTIVAAKPAQIFAGGDIVNLSFQGQNLYASDVTSIVAGRDIVNTPLSSSPIGGASNVSVPLIEVGGPGFFDIEAGRDIGPLVGNKPNGGIRSVGDLYNAWVGRSGADISVLFGTGPGVAWDAFAAAYLDPDAASDDVPSFTPDLIAAVSQYQADQDRRGGGAGVRPDLTADQAWAAFQTLPQVQRQALIEKAFFKVLAVTGADYNNPDSPNFNKYARGYQAIETLFPSALGYTKNNLEGGTNGAATLVSTGNLDIRGSTIQTQQGGNIDIMGPGGRILVGSTASPPYLVDSAGKVLVGPQALGVLAWEAGEVNIFSDRSLLLAQSRIFTERGGDMTIWSSNGDVNAGKGAKTSTEQAPLRFVCTPDFFCRVDAGAAVSGAGIAAFAAAAGDPSPTVTLVAPRGTVDAGDAGIRVAGNLIVAAQYVANADNIQVEGAAIGVPTNAVDVGGNLDASSAAASAVQEVAEAMQQSRRNDRPSTITVSVIGFGLGADACDPSTNDACPAN